VFDATICHDNRCLAQHRHVLNRIRLEIEFDRMESLSKEGGELVEQAGLHPDELVFRCLAELRNFHLFFWLEIRQFACVASDGGGSAPPADNENGVSCRIVRAVATSSAAELLIPAPIGTSECMAALNPLKWMLRFRS